MKSDERADVPWNSGYRELREDLLCWPRGVCEASLLCYYFQDSTLVRFKGCKAPY